jgi:hypothetical protein
MKQVEASKEDKKSVDKECHQDIKEVFVGRLLSVDALLPPCIQ